MGGTRYLCGVGKRDLRIMFVGRGGREGGEIRKWTVVDWWKDSDKKLDVE